DRVAVLQLARQRRDATVDLRAGAVQSHFRVHREREVDRRRTARKLLDVTLRREDKDLVLEQVDAEELHEFLRLARVLLPLQHLPEPGERLVYFVTRAARGFLVTPVRSDTILGRAVHLAGADLDLVEPPTRTED